MKSVTPVSLRERKKLEKRERLQVAAERLFLKQGYENTSTHQVAEAAGVAKGTLFLYARSKEDLLFLDMHDRLERVVDARLATAPKKGVLAQVLHVFRGVFDMYAEVPELAKLFVRALPGAKGPQADRVNAFTFSFLHRVMLLVQQAQERKEVAPHVDPALAAQSFFALYFMALLGWLSGLAELDDAFATLVRALEQYRQGLKP
jgi:AcrR family transcriptional regulator